MIDGKLAGYIARADEIRPESAEAIKVFKKNDIKVYMATGDNEKTAKAVSEKLGLDGYYAEVQLPDGAPAAVGIWRDEGDAIAYTHAHMPFEGHERPMRVRHLTIEERTAEKLTTRNYRLSTPNIGLRKGWGVESYRLKVGG